MHPVGALVLLCIGVGFFTRRRKRRRPKLKVVPTPVLAPEEPPIEIFTDEPEAEPPPNYDDALHQAQQPEFPHHGLRLHRTGIEIESWDAWMDYAPEKFVEAVAQGLGDPGEILAHLMNDIFPALRWPPPADSPYLETWDRLVVRVDQALPRVAANGRPGLRVLD